MASLDNYRKYSSYKNALSNYITARDSAKRAAPVEKKTEKRSELGIIGRLLATGGDLLGNVVTGAAKGVEGIADAAMGVVGGIGGIFDKDFQRDVRQAIEYDATNEWLGEGLGLNRVAEQSFANESEILKMANSVASGVGQMLPAVAVSLIPGLGQAASAASLATMGVSAAGSGTEEAFKDGADYNKGLLYGAVSGATEVVTEKLFGALTKGLTGKGILDFSKEVADQGAKRVIKGAIEEGTEELVSHGVNPLAKAIYKGKDALKEYGTADYYKEGARAFLAGAGTGMVYGGTVGKAINRAKGLNEDISAAVDANENIQKKLTRAQDNNRLTDSLESEAAESRMQNLKSIEAKLQSTDAQTRERYIKNYRLGDTFNPDGSLKAEILAQESRRVTGVELPANPENGENSTTAALDSRYYSTGLRGEEQRIIDDLAAMSAETGEDIHVHTEELSDKAQENLTKFKKALTSMNEHRGESENYVNYVIVNPNSKFNGAERHGNTIYIAADALERDASASYLDEASRSGNFAGTLMHEYEHTNEIRTKNGHKRTAADLELLSYLEQDPELVKAAEERVYSDYGISSESIENIRQKKKNGIELTAEEKQRFATFDSEYGATLSEYAFGNEYVMRRLVIQNEPLVERIIGKLGDLKARLAGKSDGYSRTQRKRINKALDLSLKAAEAAGKKNLAMRIMAMREEDEEAVTPTDGSNTVENAENEAVRTTNGENMSVSAFEKSKTKYSFAGEKAKTADKLKLSTAEQMLKEGVDSETIRKETGWFKGYDGKWRFEIDDSDIEINLPTGRFSKLFDIVTHNKLFEAYPELKDVFVTLDDASTGNGSYSRTMGDITLSRSLLDSPTEFRNVLIHEIQHAVQDIEGFARGASIEYWNRRLEEGYDGRQAHIKSEERELLEQMKKIRVNDGEFLDDMELLDSFKPNHPRGKVDWDTLEQIEEDSPAWKNYDRRRDALSEKWGEDKVWNYLALSSKLERIKHSGERHSTDLYLDTAGEIEARDAAKRAEMSSEQRKNTRPDIDQEDVVFAEGSSVSYFAKNVKSTEGDSIKKQLREHLNEVNKMEPVADIRYNVIDKKKAREDACALYKSLGFKVDRQNFGIIELGEREIGESSNYLNTDAEFAAWMVIPKVLKRGKLISGHTDHKNNGFPTYTIAAPVVINGQRGNVVVIVKKTGKNRYKTHRILMPDGSNFIYNNINENAESTGSDILLEEKKKGPDIDSASNISIPDSAEKVNSETKFSYKSPSEGSIHKQVAQWEKLKVYDKNDAEKMLNTILPDVMELSDEDAAILTRVNRKEAETLLWAKLNQAKTDTQMRKAAEKVADFIVSRSLVKSWMSDPYEIERINTAETVLSHLKPYIHNLRLSHIKADIAHRYDKDAGKVSSKWGTKKTGFGVDQIITELNSNIKGYGFPFDAGASEADIFFAINDAYEKAKSELERAYEAYSDRTLDREEQARLKRDITEKILKVRESVGNESELARAATRFKAELWKANQQIEYMKQYNVLIAKVDTFRELVMGKFENANTYHPDLFTGSVEQLKKIVRGGVLSIKATREAVGKLAQWYHPDNPVISESVYDASVKEKMTQIADRGLSDYAGKRVDGRELLEPFKHRIDLSSIKDDIKAIYGEETLSILATWNAKPDVEKVTLEDVASTLAKEGVKITGGDFELFAQIDQIYRDAVGPFTTEDLKNLSDIVAYFTKFIKNFNKVWNGKRYVEAEPIARRYVDTMQKNKGITVGWFKNLLNGRYGRNFFRPETLARRMDLYEDGFYTSTLREFRQGLIQANDYEYEMMQAVTKFDAEHKHYFSELAKRRIEFRGHKIPADVAMSLYMTSKRQQAQAGLAMSGFKYNDGKDAIDVQGYMPEKIPNGIELGAERMQNLLWAEFSKEDKAFIAIAESLFNGKCKQLKHDTDMNTKGYSNTVDGYYYPIKRAFVAKSVDSDFEDLMGRASNKSFNQDTVRGAKGVLCIMPLTEVLGRHVRGVSQYASLATVVRNYDTIYNLDLGGNANDPTSVAREGEKVWKEGGDYFKKMLADMQGIGNKQSALISLIRGNYATFQLGGNPKTWVTQFSSFFASTSVLKFDNVIKGFGIDGSDVDEYCTLAKLRNANNDAIMAQANANKPGLLPKRTKIGNISKKVSDVLMTPIGVVDRIVIKKLFGACQAEIESRSGEKVGTKDNKVKAGKLLEEVILKTQQNSLATERSAAMRSDNELVKSLTMFSADGMNVFGQVIDSFGEVTTLKARLRAAANANEKETLEKRLKEAGRKARGSVFALVSSAAFMAAIGLLFNWIYHRIDEEDEPGDIALDTTVSVLGNMLGGLPLFRDACSYFTDGYEVENYMYSVLNDTLEAAASARDLFVSAFSDSFDCRNAARTIRQAIYAGGQLVGIPARNLYNVTYSILGFFPSVKYGIDSAFYEPAYSKDIKMAIEAGDETALSIVIETMTGERIGAVKSDKVREELNSLTLKGYSVLPRAIADSVTVGEETITLTNTQKKQFKEIYGIANETLESLVKLKGYDKVSEEVRAKSIKMIYDIYYDLALENLTGVDSENKNVLFAEAIDIEELALIASQAKALTADKDKNGNIISGTKKAKVEKLIQAQQLTAAQKYMIMGYLGYTNKNGRAQVVAYINRLKLTKEEKALLLKYSGYN